MNSTRALFAFGTCVLLHHTGFATVVAPAPATLQISVDGAFVRQLNLIVVGQDSAGYPVYGLNPNGSAYQSLAGLGFHDEDGNLMEGHGWVFGTAGGERIAFKDATADTDPFLSYAISVTDTGSPSTFSFSFSTGIVLPPGSTLAKSSVAAAVTDGTDLDAYPDGNPSETVGARISNLKQDSYLNSDPLQDLFVDIGELAPIDAPVGDSNSGSVNTGFVTGPVNPVVGSFTTLTVVTSFGLSGYDDNVGLTGRVDIVPTIPTNIPEPGTAAFSLAGLGVLVLRRVRPRSA